MFFIDLENLPNNEIKELIYQRANATKIEPELVTLNDLKGSIHYKRFKDIDKKETFRINLLTGLRNKWTDLLDLKKAETLENQFKDLANSLSENGAMIFGEIINKIEFTQLIKSYNSILKNYGSESWIHSYINLANHPDFLSNADFNKAFLHPLLIALISYRVGGPIRIVDARGKDAQPITVLAQDNMLHIDNTPFADEFKIILVWEKNKPSGPKGQNFVFIPGTQKGFRNCFQRSDGSIWSSENASIFITKKSVQHIFDFQAQVLGVDVSPMVVEATHSDKPLTIVFAAGSLVHHRYRTDEGLARSCVILAFHRATDNVGQFISANHLSQFSSKIDDLNSFLFGYHAEDDIENKFINALANEAVDIIEILNKLNNNLSNEQISETIIVEQSKVKLNSEEIEDWKAIVTSAPRVEQIKSEKLNFPLNKRLNQEEMFEFLKQMMLFDKHGPLDLILYSDNHEEIRKWTRNQIREMKKNVLEERLKDWSSSIEQPTINNLLTPTELKTMADYLADKVSKEIENKNDICLDPIEKISFYDAFRSVRQAFIALGEAMMRCESEQAFLSSCLFIFWACDLFNRMQVNKNEEIKKIGHNLLMNYISTAILIEKNLQYNKIN